MVIGMIGGIGPESTVDYYKQIVRRCHEKLPGSGYPQIIVNSIDMAPVLKLAAARQWDELAQKLAGDIAVVADAGADFAFMASNTPHIVFDSIQSLCRIPLVSIVEAARRRAKELSLKKAGLLGTAFVMKSSCYQQEFAKSGISVVVPSEAEQYYINDKIFSEIEEGVFLPETRAGLLSIIKRMADDEKIDSVILGCTELPLILDGDAFGIPFLDTMSIHVKSIVAKYFGQ